MEIAHLRTFVAIAHTGSITRASEQLHLSQPAVSAQIKALEEMLGLSLFERAARGMRITPEGETLLGHAERVLGAEAALAATAARLKATPGGTFRLGVSGRLEGGPLEGLVATLAREMPQLSLVLRHEPSRIVASAIREGALDAGLIHLAGDADSDLVVEEIDRFAVFLAAPPGMVSDPADWRALADLPWIVPARGTACGMAVEALFRRHQFRPHQVIAVDQEALVRPLIARGAGLGLLHARAAEKARADRDVEILGETGPPIRFVLACRASEAETPVLAVTRRVLRRLLAGEG